jgi:hypothetical protein
MIKKLCLTVITAISYIFAMLSLVSTVLYLDNKVGMKWPWACGIIFMITLGIIILTKEKT